MDKQDLLKLGFIGFKRDLTHLSLNEKGEPLKELQLFKTGEFVHWSGTEFEVNDEFMDGLIANFDLMKEAAKDKQHVIPFDYNHGIYEADPEKAKASGWISELFKKEDGVYCKVEWTPEAEEKIRNKEYLFTSPTFAMEDKDEHGDDYSGPVLWAAALTNVPFLRGMESAIANKKTVNSGGNEMKKKLVELFALPAEADDGTILAAAKADRTTVTKLSEVLELKGDNEGADIVEAVKVMQADKATALENAQKAEEALQAFKKETSDIEVEAKIDAAIAEGKMLPADKDKWLEKCKADNSNLELVELLKPVIDLSKTGSGNEPPETEKKDLDSVVRARMAEDKCTYIEAQKLIEKENPELVKQYVESTRQD